MLYSSVTTVIRILNSVIKSKNLPIKFGSAELRNGQIILDKSYTQATFEMNNKNQDSQIDS